MPRFTVRTGASVVYRCAAHDAAEAARRFEVWTRRNPGPAIGPDAELRIDLEAAQVFDEAGRLAYPPAATEEPAGGLRPC